MIVSLKYTKYNKKLMVTVVITTYNEKSHIAECVASAMLLTRSVLVVDMQSTDGTAQSALRAGAQVISIERSAYVEPARMTGIAEAKGDWVFILDPDERITEEAAAEILRVMSKQNPPFTYYKVPRKNIFGKTTWLRYGGWWPDYQTRLIKKTAIKDWPARIHSTPIIEGEGGYLTEAIKHYFHGNVTSMVEKTITFENIESDLLYDANRSVSTPTFFRKFLGELWRRLIVKRGFLDGKIGIMESVYQAFSKTITYLLLYEKKNRRPVHPIS